MVYSGRANVRLVVDDDDGRLHERFPESRSSSAMQGALASHAGARALTEENSYFMHLLLRFRVHSEGGEGQDEEWTWDNLGVYHLDI